MKLKGLIVMFPNAAVEVYGGNLNDEIAQRIELLSPVLSREALLARPDLVAEADVLFSSWGAPVVDESFLQNAGKLRAIFYAGGTVREWATDALWRRGVIVSSAYAVNAQPVAEYALAAILFSLKNGWRYALGAKRLGHMPARIPCAGGFGSKVGLISLGTIARLLRERLGPFDVEVLAYDPFVNADEAAALGVKLGSLDEIFSTCDVVSLHTPLLAETEGMITGRHFGLMKPGATFLNTARGKVVREDELIAVFTRRDDLTAVLDVTFPEPPAPGSPLYTLPNVVLTPHIAGSLGDECRRMGRFAVDEFDRWQRGEPLRGQLSAETAARMA